VRKIVSAAVPTPATMVRVRRVVRSRSAMASWSSWLQSSL